MFGVALNLRMNLVFFELTNGYSRKVWAYLLKHKIYVFDIFSEWKVVIEKQIIKKSETPQDR